METAQLLRKSTTYMYDTRKSITTIPALSSSGRFYGQKTLELIVVDYLLLIFYSVQVMMVIKASVYFRVPFRHLIDILVIWVFVQKRAEFAVDVQIAVYTQRMYLVVSTSIIYPLDIILYLLYKQCYIVKLICSIFKLMLTNPLLLWHIDFLVTARHCRKKYQQLQAQHETNNQKEIISSIPGHILTARFPKQLNNKSFLLILINQSLSDDLITFQDKRPKN